MAAAQEATAADPPILVLFACQAGYQPNGYQSCTPINELTPPNNSCPTVGNPIAPSDGGKIEDVLDYATGDGKFFIRRYYRSLPHIHNLQSYNGAFGGAAGGWRFAFNMELHLSGGSGDYPTLYLPDGVAYDFARNGSSFAFKVPINQRSHYALSYVGTPPANWESVTGGPTQWKVMDPENRVWILQTFSQPNSGAYTVARPISMTAPGGYSWTFTYDAYGAVRKIVDSYGRTFGFTWNYQYLSGLVVPGTQSTPFMPTPQSVASISLPGGNVLRYSYNPPIDANGSQPVPVIQLLEADLLDSTGAPISSTTYQYENPVFETFLTGVTDARGVRYATFGYDALGRSNSTAHAGGADQYTLSYNTAAATFPNILSRYVTNPLGKVTEYDYSHNADGNATLLANVIGAASANCPASAASTTYDANNYTAAQTDEEGRVTAYVNDSQGRPTSITRGYGTPQAATTTISWNATYNLPNQIVAPSLTTNLTINPATGLVTQVQQVDTTTQTTPYSTNGQMRTWGFAYNATGQLTSVTDPSGASVAYNETGGLQSITDQLGHVTTITAWNARNQPTSFTDPNGGVVNLAYEPARGLLSQMIVDAAGSPATTTIRYDQVGEVTQITLPNGASETYTYDGARRLTTVSNSAGETINYTRDAMGDATAVSIASAAGATTYSRARGFDELGRLIKQFAAGTEAVQFGYDRTNNLTSVTDPLSNVFSYGFDPLNRLIKEVDQGGAAVNLARDGQDNIVGYQAFAYTATHRLASASGYYGALAWTYDAVGNRLSETRNGVASSYLYPLGSNLLQSVASTANTRSFAYDAAGNVLTDSRNGALGMTFSYDVAGRLASAYQTGAPQNAASYAYDAFGRLASRTVNGTTTLYIHDINDHIIAETDATGATQREYIWLNDTPVAVVDGVSTASPQLYSVLTDHLGRPARMIAQDWSWAWDVIYEPFGAVSYVWSNPETMDIRFPGQWFQLETGLAYNWHRHYDATLGRYIQPDPLGLPALMTDGPSTFGYAKQNPLVYEDPLGLYGTQSCDY